MHGGREVRVAAVAHVDAVHAALVALHEEHLQYAGVYFPAGRNLQALACRRIVLPGSVNAMLKSCMSAYSLRDKIADALSATS